jgi:hypothetical protein
MWGFGWFFPFFGFIFFLVVIGLVIGAFKRAAWGGRGGHGSGRGWYGPGRGWYGPGSGYGRGRGSHRPGTNDQFDQWHRRMHGESDQPAEDEPANAPWDPPAQPKDENTRL